MWGVFSSTRTHRQQVMWMAVTMTARHGFVTQESEALPLEGTEAHNEDTELSQGGGDVCGLGRDRKVSEES